MALTHVSDADFGEEVLQAEGLTIVDFWAPWCGPCKMLSPIVEQLAEEYAGKAKICKLETDENQNVAVNFGIMSIPTLIFFKNGIEIYRHIGLIQKPKLAELIDANL